MSAKSKFYLAAATLLLALTLLLGHSEEKTSSLSASAERSRPVGRSSADGSAAANSARKTARASGFRRAKDFTSMVKLINESGLKLSQLEIEDYLQSQNRNARSLLSAFHVSNDEAYLKEATEKFPHDPQVLLSSLRLSGDPAKQLEILESFKQADPENGLGNCLTARTLFELGRSDEALAELLKSSGKPIQNFMLDFCQNTEEAYLSAGLSPVEAKISSLYSSANPTLMQLASMDKKLNELRLKYEAEGDHQAAESLTGPLLELGGSLQQGHLLIDQLVGIRVEKAALKWIDSEESNARLAQLDQQKNAIQDSARKISSLMQNPAVSENDWLLYFDRVKLFGENTANGWMLGKYPNP